jgi:hypothetical protein
LPARDTNAESLAMEPTVLNKKHNTRWKLNDVKETKKALAQRWHKNTYNNRKELPVFNTYCWIQITKLRVSRFVNSIWCSSMQLISQFSADLPDAKEKCTTLVIPNLNTHKIDCII